MNLKIRAKAIEEEDLELFNTESSPQNNVSKDIIFYKNIQTLKKSKEFKNIFDNEFSSFSKVFILNTSKFDFNRICTLK